ncbi:MAG: hypothetical protein KAH32_03515 [Chlamydiia bacterium]|nr:hypothetical protein [Chlamydiia bacterium]
MGIIVFGLLTTVTVEINIISIILGIFTVFGISMALGTIIILIVDFIRWKRRGKRAFKRDKSDSQDLK